MAGKSQYMEGKVLDLLRGTTFTAPADVYVALYTTAPTDSTTGTEVTGSTYARIGEATFTFTAPAGTPRNTGNTSEILIGGASGMPACTVVAVGLLDALTVGNLLYWVGITARRSSSGIPRESCPWRAPR